MKCTICNRSFPDRFFAPLHTNDGTIVADPECARKEIERIHGISFKKFTGEYARQLHEDFMAWKKNKEVLRNHGN